MESERTVPRQVEPREASAEVPQPTQAQADEFKEQAHLGEGGAEPPPATTPPSNVDVPMVSGPSGLSAVVGETLTCTMGNWGGEPTGYAYAWKSDGATDLGGSGDTYVVAASDAGHSITCVVTATNAVGSTTAPPSNAVAVAAAGGETQTRRK